MSADPLLQPFRLKTLELRNRIISTSHEPGYGEGGMPTDRYRAYHVEKARGGVGLTMIGGSAVVSQDSPASFGNLHLWDDAVVGWLRKLADEVHAEGAAVTCQITHLGHRTSNHAGDWLPTVSVDHLREPAHRAFTKRADIDDLQRITADFATAAARCEAAGLDGIEIMAHGHLLDAFLSPDLNTRADEFGGSFSNRLRFPLMVIGAVKAAVGPDFVVGIRTGADEQRPGGLEEPDGIAVIQHLVGAGLDFVSVNRGHIATEEGLSRLIPPMGEASAPHLAAAARIKDKIDVPVMHGSKIADLATARHAVSEGLVDLVGMTRAMIADPQLVRRLMAGEEDRVRPCVGASLCIDAPYTGEAAFCIHNASTGRELALPHRIAPAARVRDAVVVGAGPAGLEAARVLAERGHRVTVLEAADEPGGLLRLAARVPRRRDLIGIVDWRVAECRRLGVAFRYNTFADAADVRALGADLVVVATGGLADTGFLDYGADLVTETPDVIGGTVRPRGSVLVYDDNGSHPALDAVEVLVATPAVEAIEYVTPERTVAPDLGGVNAPPYLRTFVEHDVRTSLLLRLEGVERYEGRLRAVFRSEVGSGASGATGKGAVRVERVVDRVVVERGTLPNDEVFTELAPESSNGGAVDPTRLLALAAQPGAGEGFQVFRVGDAVSSRAVHAAVVDSFRLCSAL